MIRRLPTAVAAALFISLCPAAAAAETACSTLLADISGQPPGPVFLASFPTAQPGPLQNTAFLYDNAVASIALVGCGHLDRAGQIGDAILAALARDPHWTDGRLRNAYGAGPVTDGPVKLPGWWSAAENRWDEDGYQVGSDTGNMAWAMLALLTLYDGSHDARYRDGAERIARHVETALSTVTPAGFDGGFFGFDDAPVHNSWKSTEHNTDLAAAFDRLARASKDDHWATQASVARGFVAAMWQPACRCYAVGTGDDGHTLNPVLALDAQIWPSLAIADQAAHLSDALDTAAQRLRQNDGYAYGEAKGGVWVEGTAQVSLLMSLQGKSIDAAVLLAALNRDRTPDGWYNATDAEDLPTGFGLQTDPSKPRVYFKLPHLAALAWVALAEQRFNPFTGAMALPDDQKTGGALPPH